MLLIVLLEKTLESLLDSKEMKAVNYEVNKPWIFIGRTEAEAPIIWPPVAKSWLIGKDPDSGKDLGQEKKGATEDETVGWHHWLNGHEFEQAPRDSEGQGSLVCCSPWGHKVSNTTEWLNRTDATHHAWILFLPRKRILEDRNEFTLVYLGITLNTLNTRCPEYTEITWRACAHL